MLLRYRIALTFFLLEAVMIVFVLWQTIGPSLERTSSLIEQSDQVLLSVLGDAGKVALLTSEYEDIQIQFENTRKDSHISEIILFAKGGKVVASNKAGNLGKNIVLESMPAEEYWRHQQITGSSGALGRISIRYSNYALITANVEGGIRGLVVAGFSMSIIALLGLLLGFALSRRLEILAVAADKVASGDYSGNFEVSGNDEIARVGNSFKLMIEKTRESLTGLQSELAERKTAQNELQISEQHLSMAMRASNAGFWIRYLPFKQVVWSDENYRLLGYSPGEIEATPENWAARIHPDDRVQTMRNLEEAIDNCAEINLEYRVVHSDGTIRWIHNVGKVLLDDNGLAEVACGIQIDITDRKDLEEKLRHSQRLEAVGQLTGGIAHDFNNLLAVVMGNTELLEFSADGREPDQQYLQAIKLAVDRGASLTSRLLSFARQKPLFPAEIKLSDSINGLKDMFARTLGETIELKVAHSQDLWDVLVDPHQFEDALLNLALNARDAMPKGGTLGIDTSNVTLDAIYTEQYEEVKPGDYVKVSVSDSGSGMSAEVKEKAFEPFFTTKGVGEGSGLGLSMVYGFAMQSKAHILIDSEVGRGTTVNLYLPRADVAAVHTDIEGTQEEFSRGSECILIVEDDENVRKIAENILSGQGYTVVAVVDGREAIDCLEKEQQFDLLFTDLVLPGGLNGSEIAEQASRLQPGIKTLFTTGYAADAIGNELQSDSESELIHKPYRRAELLKKVQGILGSRDSLSAKVS